MSLDIQTLLLLIVSVSFLLYVLNIRWKKQRIRKKQKRGIIKEVEAKKLLEKKGYRVLEYQPEFSYTASEGMKDIEIFLKPDYLVEKRGKLLCVEVKTGQGAQGLSNKNTRRQILEYYCFAKCDGVLFVDMENKEVKQIHFPKHKDAGMNTLVFILIAVVVVLLFFII